MQIIEDKIKGNRIKVKIDNGSVNIENTAIGNKKYKDSVFVDLFGSDKTAKVNALSLYNALHGTDYKIDEVNIDSVQVEQVLFMNFKNDVGFLVGEKCLVLTEHQSTICPNMPLRDLMYVARAYEQLVETVERYSSVMVKIPYPEFYVLYNGSKDRPEEETLKLSDMYIDIPSYFDEKTGKMVREKPTLELTVKIININSSKQHKLLEKCHVLMEYTIFIEKINEYKEKGEKLEIAIKRAIEYCIENDVLKEYLTRKGSEVSNMLLAEYDYQMDIAIHERDAMERGREEGREEERIKSEEKIKILKLEEKQKREKLEEKARLEKEKLEEKARLEKEKLEEKARLEKEEKERIKLEKEELEETSRLEKERLKEEKILGNIKLVSMLKDFIKETEQIIIKTDLNKEYVESILNMLEESLEEQEIIEKLLKLEENAKNSYAFNDDKEQTFIKDEYN